VPLRSARHLTIGVTADQLTDLALLYVAVRDTGDEVRTTYYFTANLTVPGPTECSEGDLKWFELTMNPSTLDMPPTARIAFAHWLAAGRFDERLRFIMVDADGCETGPF